MSPPCWLIEEPTAIGPVDLMCRDADGVSVAVVLDYDALRGTDSDEFRLF